MNIKIKNFVTFLFLFVVCKSGVAQQNLTLYHFQSLPQNTYCNPALEPGYKIHIGIPALSSTNLVVNSQSLRIRDLINVLEAQDSGGYRVNINKVGGLFATNNYYAMNSSFELLHVGFKLGKSRVLLTANEKVKARINIPGDFVDFFIQGNGGDNLNRTFNFNWAADLLHTREYALALQRKFLNEKLTLGVRAKYIYGLNAIVTEKNDISLHTDPNTFDLTMRSNIRINTASSLLDITKNQKPNWKNGIYGANNYGWGADLGAMYALTKRIDLSASIIDLGKVQWATNTNAIASKNSNAEYTFKGFDISGLFNDSADFEKAISQLGDSVFQIFALDTISGEAFSTTLFTDFYLGAKFKLTKNHHLGALVYGSFYNKSFYPAFTLSYNGHLAQRIGLSVSYTATQSDFLNAGFGISGKLGPVQLYLLTDNIIPAFNGRISNMGVRFGTNLVFGKVDKKKKRKR